MARHFHAHSDANAADRGDYRASGALERGTSHRAAGAMAARSESGNSGFQSGSAQRASIQTAGARSYASRKELAGSAGVGGRRGQATRNRRFTLDSRTFAG